MIVQDIYLESYDWHVRVYYAINSYYINDILNDLINIDCDKEAYHNIEKILEKNAYNVGFTYSNLELRESIILIGKTLCAAEFQDTLDHEKGHLAIHIGSIENIDPYSEDYQYLNGEIGKQMFKVAHLFLCDKCRLNLHR